MKAELDEHGVVGCGRRVAEHNEAHTAGQNASQKVDVVDQQHVKYLPVSLELACHCRPIVRESGDASQLVVVARVLACATNSASTNGGFSRQVGGLEQVARLSPQLDHDECRAKTHHDKRQQRVHDHVDPDPYVAQKVVVARVLERIAYVNRERVLIRLLHVRVRLTKVHEEDIVAVEQRQADDDQRENHVHLMHAHVSHLGRGTSRRDQLAAAVACRLSASAAR